MTTKQDIFRRGSTTYFFSSLFFPAKLKEHVFTLYAYVRTADDFVDAIPQNREGFFRFQEETWRAFTSQESADPIIHSFVRLANAHNFQKEWIEAFLGAMESDLTIRTYPEFSDLERYMYGSAEVIGLMMARLMKLPKEADTAARLQGKAMQLINFIRDIREDLSLGRVYLPEEDLARFGLTRDTLEGDVQRFTQLVQFEIDRYRTIQAEAQKGYADIPYRFRVPIMTAASMYNWTASCIARDPQVVFARKVKPGPLRVMTDALRFFLWPHSKILP